MNDQLDQPPTPDQPPAMPICQLAHKTNQTGSASSASKLATSDLLQAKYYSHSTKIKASQTPLKANYYIVDVLEYKKPDSKSQHYDFIIFKIQSAKANNSQAIILTDEQCYWLRQIRLPYARRPLQISQMRVETVKLYATLTAVIDDHLKSEENSSLAEIASQPAANPSADNDNILYALECLAEIVVIIHYLQKCNSRNLRASLILIAKHLDRDAYYKILQVITAHRHKMSAITAETSRALNSNDYGFQPTWWDKSGYLRRTQKISMIELWLLDYCFPHKHKQLQDEDFKLAAVKLYLALNHYLRRHLTLKFGYDDSQFELYAQRTDIYPYHQFMHFYKIEIDTLTYIWTLVIHFHLYKSSVKYQETYKYFESSFRIDIQPTLAEFWAIKTNRQLACRLKPTAWRAGLILVAKKLKSGSFKAADKLTACLLSDWENSSQAPHVQQALINTWLKYDPVKSLSLAYLYLKQNPSTPLKTTNLDRHILNTAQRRQLWQNLCSQALSDEQVQAIISQICRSPQHKLDSKLRASGRLTRQRVVKINPQQQKQIASDHASTSHQLDASLKTDELPVETPAVSNQTPLSAPDTDISQLFEDDPFKSRNQLKSAHQQLLKLLLKQPQLSQAKVKQLAQAHQLFPANLIDKINQATYTKYGRSLILKTESAYKVAKADLELIKSLLKSSQTSMS